MAFLSFPLTILRIFILKDENRKLPTVQCSLFSVHPVARYRAEDSTHALQWLQPTTIDRQYKQKSTNFAF